MARTFGTGNYLVYDSTAENGFITFPVTMACWVYYTGSFAGETDCAMSNVSTSAGGTIIFHAVAPATSSNLGWTDGATFNKDGGVKITANAWQHIAVTVDSSANSFAWKMYLNGVATPNSGTATTPGASGATRYAIGNQGGFGASIFNGNIADAATWNVVLTPLEIAGLARGARPWAIKRGTVFVYHPIDGLKSPEPDLGGAAPTNVPRNAVVTGTPLLASGPPFTTFTPRWPQFLGPPPIVTILLPQSVF